MLQIILIYFIGKYHFDLAGKHNKGKWPFAILGVVAYFIGMISCVFVIVFFIQPDLTSGSSFENLWLDLVSMPVGILATYILYQYLKKSWAQTRPELDDSLLDDELIQ